MEKIHFTTGFATEKRKEEHQNAKMLFGFVDMKQKYEVIQANSMKEKNVFRQLKEGLVKLL